MAQPPLPDDDALRTLAQEILQRPEYARWRSVESDAVRDLLAQLERFLSWMADLSHAEPLLYAAILLGLTLLALLLLTHVVISIRSALLAPGPAVPDSPADEELSFRAEAERLAASGHYLEAARRLQLDCIASLLGRGVLELRRFEPNATLRRRLATAALRPEERREFASLIDRLETRLFRDRIEDAALYGAWRELHARLVAPGRTA